MTSAKINNFALFLTRKEKNRLLHTQEYKTVLGEATFIFTALNDENINKLPDSMTCIVAPDITGTKPRQFISDLVNAVENDGDRVYAYSGYRFKDVLGTVNALQKVDAYNRMPFVPRHTVGDSRPEKIDVITNGTFACSARTLKYAMPEAVSFGRYDVNLSIAFSKTGTEIVCIVPSTDWSDLPKTSKPVEVMVRMADESRYPLFSYNGWHVVTDKHTVSARACPSDPDSVAVIITTHNRTDTAKTTIESLVSRLKYPKLHWLIADDRSDPGHVKQLVDKFVELGIKDVYVTETNDEHWGLGASLNNALTAAFRLTDVVLTTEDDWYLQYDIDISEFVDTIKNDQTVGVIRLGAANHLSKYMTEYTDSLACVSVEKYKRDRDKTGRLNSLQVAIRHKRLFDRVGFYIENSNPDMVETDMNSRFVNYGLLKILWPKAYCTYDLVCAENPFLHFGESTVGHSWEQRSPVFVQGKRVLSDVVVSMSTYKDRFKVLDTSLRSILNQTVIPWKICVVVDDCDIESIEGFLKENIDNGCVELLVGSRELGPHNKYIHTMLKYPDKTVVTFDDDADYRQDSLEKLYALHLKYPKCVCTRRAHLITYDDSGNPLPYRKWINQCGTVDYPSFDLFATGVGGVLYPPGLFRWDDETINAMKNFKNDDLFLKKIENDLGIKVATTCEKPNADPRITRDGAQANALYNINVRDGNNDKEVVRLGIHRISDQEAWPFFKIVIPVYKSSRTLRRAIESITAQTFSSFIVSVCDDGSPEPYHSENKSIVESLGDKGVFTFNDTNKYAGAARNKAMSAVKRSEYTLYLDADDVFVRSTLFEELHSFIVDKKFPDVILLPCFRRNGESNVLQAKSVTSPEKLAKARRFVAPWCKCVRSDKEQLFQEGLRRYNDGLNHWLVADNVTTVVPFNKEAVRYCSDSDTTMFGPYSKKNRSNVEALTSYLYAVDKMISTEWKHDYTETGLADEIEHILTYTIPNLVRDIGSSNFKKFLFNHNKQEH